MENKKNVVGLAGRIAGEVEKQPDIYGAKIGRASCRERVCQYV